MATRIHDLASRPLHIRGLLLGALVAAILFELGWLCLLGERYALLAATLPGLSEETVQKQMGRPDRVLDAQTSVVTPAAEGPPAEPLGQNETMLVYDRFLHHVYVYVTEEGRVRCTWIERKGWVP